jgi:4-amino-4-deoxy-L-arabinose transferase-like glycosyltransferase
MIKTLRSLPPVLPLTVLTSLCLLPFLGKAFHIDDPVWVWTTRHIQTNPLDFYGFKANWFGIEQWMYEIHKIPPLFPYYLSLSTRLFGANEVGFHLSCLIFCILAAAGIFYLAKEFCRHPFWATLLAIFTPLFLLTASSVLADTMMLAFWNWAFVFWIWGMKKRSPAYFGISVLLVSACALTKYNGASLIPLLLFYTFLKDKKQAQSTVFLLVPILSLVLMQLITQSLYGQGMLTAVASYSLTAKDISLNDLGPNSLTVLAFLGGGTLVGLVYLPFTWTVRALVKALGCFLVWGVLLVSLGYLGLEPLAGTEGIDWSFLFQTAIWSAAGLMTLGLAVREVVKKPSADSLTLFFWVFGTVLFAGVLNWSITGRALLPLIPTTGILFLRYVDDRPVKLQGRWKQIRLLPIVLSACLSLYITWADVQLAEASREGAAIILREHSMNQRVVWFQGHWGFQYYMEELGARAVDTSNPRIEAGDLLVVPSNNTNTLPIDSLKLNLLDVIRLPGSTGLTTQHHAVGAGFYSDVFGPLPFAFGKIPDSQFHIFEATGRSY